MKPLAAILALTLLTTPATAKGLDGNTLHEMCTTSNLRPNVVFYAGGLVQGAVLAEQKFFCIPIGVNMQQMGDAACKFVAENPEARHLSAGTVVVRSFSLAWPCSEP
jgi:Rap1a immunity proteins